MAERGPGQPRQTRKKKIVRIPGPERLPPSTLVQPLSPAGDPSRSGSHTPLDEGGALGGSGHESHKLFSLLQEIAAEATGSATNDEVFSFTLKRICTELGWCIGQVWSLARETIGTLVSLPMWYSQDCEIYGPFRRASEETLLPTGVGLIGSVWATGQPMWLADVTKDDRFLRKVPAALVGLHSAFAFPVLVGKRVIAVMEFFTVREMMEPNAEVLVTMAHLGSVVGLVVERKHAEAIFSGFFDATPDAMLLVNSEGKVVLANRQTEQLFGYAKQDLPGLPIEVLIPQYVSERQGVPQVGCPTLPKLHPLDKGLELTAIRKDRSEFPVEVSLSPLETQDGVMVVAAVRDITERKHAEAALRESEDRFRQAFDHAAIGKALVSLDRRWLKINRALCDLIGYAEDELLGNDFYGITHPDDVPADFTATQRMLAGELPTFELEQRYLHKRGHEVWVLLSISLVRNAAGAPLYFIVEAQDLTERKRLEHQLRERERLATIGTTVTKIAHEIGNPLNGMSSTLQVLERQLAQQPNTLLIESVQDLKHETNRLRSLLQELHSFARPLELSLRPTNIVTIAAEALRSTTAYFLEHGIGIEQDLSAMPPVLADEEKCRQVLLNLYKNAAEAMPDGGILTLRSFHTGANVCLEVQDTGTGIPHGVEIFAPFVTTKAHGTGLGLAIVKQIMDAHGGTIAYTSSAGRGTTFRVTFPTAVSVEPHNA